MLVTVKRSGDNYFVFYGGSMLFMLSVEAWEARHTLRLDFEETAVMRLTMEEEK